MLRKMRWSPWKLIVTPDKPQSKRLGSEWILRTINAKVRCWKKRSLFSHVSSPALYEVAVQTEPHKKRNAVFCKLVKSLPDSRRWEQRLLGTCRKNIDSAIKRGYNIFLRSAVIGRRSSTKLQLSRKLMKMYDYAWSNLNGHCRI